MTKIFSTNNPEHLYKALADRFKAAEKVSREGLTLHGPKGTGKTNLTAEELGKFRYSSLNSNGLKQDSDIFEAQPISTEKSAFFKAHAQDGIGTIPSKKKVQQIRDVFKEVLNSYKPGTKLNPIEITGHAIKD